MAVNFEAPDDFFVGFRDYLLDNFPSGGTVYGPIYEVTNYGGPDDTTLETDPTPAAGIADDLIGNGFTFQVILGDLNGDGLIEDTEIIGTFIDYGDLHEFDAYFEQIVATNRLTFTSVELMKQHVLFANAGENQATTGWRLDAYHDRWSAGLGDEVRGLWAVSPRTLDSVSSHHLRGWLDNTRFSLYGSGGLRWIQLKDEFSWEGRGSIIGRTGADVRNDHHVFGPQLGLGTLAENGMFRFEAVALGLVGYGHFDSELNGIFGSSPIPGALNSSINAQTTTTLADREKDYVAWHGETRLTASCQLTQRLRFDATWRWVATGPVHRAYESMRYTVPSFTLRDNDGGTAYGSDWFLGLTYTR